MEKHYVGSEIGQLRSVMLHRPNLSLKRLTPSNCQELLFDDVLSVERAGEEHDIFANTLRQQGIEVLLLTDLLTQTLDIYSAAIFLIPICISFDTAEKRRYATYLILNRRFSFEF